MNSQPRNIAIYATLLCTATTASAQFVNFTDQTGTRMPTGAGQNTAATSISCPEEKDYTWGDVDHDGDLDLVCMRKRPLSCEGGRPNVLFMNEGGILIDRTSTYATAAINAPGSLGFQDSTNDRQAVLVDLNNDGWLDLATCITMSDGLSQQIGYPRIYMNMGEVGGAWQGFRYEFNRIPLFSGVPATARPRFCSVSAGDVNSDGYADLFFVDYDTPESAYCPLISESPANDINNRLLMNQGAANPGFFVDETSTRLGGLSAAAFGSHSLMADLNGDGNKDIIRINTLVSGQNTSVFSNTAGGTGFFTSKNIYPNLAPYGVAVGDLNGDGRLDLVMADDSSDRFLINTGNDGSSNPNMTITVIPGSTAGWFTGPPSVYDLDNDGRLDAIMPDQDIDTNYGTNRRMQVFRNTGASFSEDGMSGMTANDQKAVYNTATFDIDGDGWRDFIIGRGNPAGGHTVGSTSVFMNNGKPGLTFSFPGGLPSSLTPGNATNFNVQLTGIKGGTPLANSGQIRISVNGGAFNPTFMTPLGGNLYQATIPIANCGDSIRYYFSGQISTGTTFIHPPTGIHADTVPAFHYLVGASNSTSVALTDDFEAGAGAWTVQNDGSLTSGGWEVATPVGTWNEGLRAAPDSDASPAGVNAFVTQNGLVGGAPVTRDVDGGPTHLISPIIDLSGSNATVSFARWFYSNTPGDVLQVSVSNDGGSNWVNAVTINAPPRYHWNGYGAEYTQTAWITQSFNVRDYIAPTAQVRIRFSVNDTANPVPFVTGLNGAGIVEAGIDDFVITMYNCALPCPADVNASGDVNIDDLVTIITSWGMTSGPADVNNDLIVNIDDLVLVITSWGGCP